MPDGSEGLELGLSWSRLREHMECKKHAALKNQGKATPHADIRVFFPGTIVDRCMRRWLEQDDPKPGQMVAMCAEVLETEERVARETSDGIVKWRHSHDKEEVLANCSECLTRLEPILYQYVIPFQYEPALRFRVPITIPYLDGTPQRIWLVGEMDLFTRYEPRRPKSVLDLKMTADDSYWRKTTGQLLFYDLAVRILEGAYPEDCWLVQPMCKERLLPFVFSEENRRELWTQIARYCTDVWRGDQALRPTTDRCGFCDTRHACPRFEAGRGFIPWPVV